MDLPVRHHIAHNSVASIGLCLLDGTLVEVPEWMTQPEAATFSLRSPPRIPLTILRDLRSMLDSAQGSLCGDLGSGRSHATKTYVQSTESVSAASVQLSGVHPGTGCDHTAVGRTTVGDTNRQDGSDHRKGGR